MFKCFGWVLTFRSFNLLLVRIHQVKDYLDIVLSRHYLSLGKS